MTFVATLEPPALWAHFDHILTIPRGSKNEENIRRYVISVAEEHGLDYEIDQTGNVVMRKPGTEGREGVPPTVLQSHLDMVQEKNSGVAHDWSKDPIQPERDGEWLKARGTTLGSDNGIGVATMLALLEADDVVHGPLELLFTVDEETGLTGAGTLEPTLLRGRRLLNLDSEEEGVLTVGCAGGADTSLSLPLHFGPAPPGGTALRVALQGLRGGHSGVDIHLQRGNAVQLLARALDAASGEAAVFLWGFGGGNKHNAIPREAHARVLVGRPEREAFERAVRQAFEAIREEYAPADPGMKLEISESESPGEVWDRATSRKALRMLAGLPHGVQSMSYDIEGLVETSTNLASAHDRNGSLVVLMSTRSSVASALAWIRQKIRAVAGLAGAEVDEGEGYPGWKPDLDSPLLAVVKDVHTRVLGTEPRVAAVHAGLECGIIGEKIPGMDMVSMGPEIQFPHSPDERVHVASVQRFWNLLTGTLEELTRT